MGMDHLAKAVGFEREHNWPQLLLHSDLAVTKLKQLKDRPMDDLSKALELKVVALDFLGRSREQLECAKEWYCLWNTKPTDMGALDAAFALIQSCIQNKEYEDAHLYASTLYEIINHKYDNKIPEDKRQEYIANGAYFLASATLLFAENGGIPPEGKQKAGQEATALARKALEIETQLFGTENDQVACAMGVLAEIIDHFTDHDDDEVLRLYEQSIAINTRVYGRLFRNVAVAQGKLGAVYFKRARNAQAANDHDREMANLTLALPHFREAARIFRAISQIEIATSSAETIAFVEERLQQLTITKTAVTATKG